MEYNPRHKFCCDSFAGHICEAGRKGLSYIPYVFDGKRSFRVQARACDADRMQYLPAARLAIPQPVGSLAIVITTGMAYCPACGTELAQWISRNEALFDELLASIGHYGAD